MNKREPELDFQIPFMSEAEVNALVDRIAKEAVLRITTQLYVEVGKSVVQKIFWAIGLIVVAGYIYFKSEGKL